MIRSEDEGDDFELSDHEINKLLIVTQTSQPSRRPKHDGYDRTGDKTSRVKMTQELEHAINIGLQYYEDNLWTEQDWVRCSTVFLSAALIFHHTILKDT